MEAAALALAVAGALALVAFRAVPFALWAAVRADLSWVARLAPLALVGATAAGFAALGMDVAEIVVRAPLAVALFAAVGWLVVELRPLGRSRLGRATLALLLPCVYVVAPVLVAGGPLLAPTLILGWDRMLAAYSLCLETAARPQPSRRDALFFLIVDPSIVWVDRARPDPGLRDARRARVGGTRLLRGIAKLSAQSMLLWAGSVVPLFAPFDPGTAAVDALSYSRFLLSSLALFATLFLAHSGLADVQIGLLALAGMRVAERYDRPYLARSPREIWRRWNTWVGAWARRYVLAPVGGWLAARLPRSVASAAAVLITFLVLGLLHDVAFWAMGAHRAPTLVAPGLCAFAIFGVGTLAWEVVLGRVRVRSRRPALAAVQWALTMQLVAAVVWLVHPMLQEGRLPAALQ